MANKEFNNIDEFIEGFTRNGPTTENFKYDGIIFGIEFQYNGSIFRITRDTIGNEKELRKKFNKSDAAYIQFFEIPVEQYPDASVDNLNLYLGCLNLYLGIFDDVYDLLDNGKIEGIPLRDIIASENAEILAID